MKAVHTSPVSILLKIGELVEGHYFPDVESHLKSSTMHTYRFTWRHHLAHRISTKIARDFKRPDAFLLWKDIVREKPRISRWTMAHIRSFISGVFEWALNRGLYTGPNPALADLPRGLVNNKKMRAYSMDEFSRLLDLFDGNVKVQAVLAVAFGGGLRKGEIQGLRWEDYEPSSEGATIHVRQSCWNGVISTPKTDSSMDDVKLAPEFCGFMEAWRCELLKERPVTGQRGLMFGRSATEPINLDSLAWSQIKSILNRCAVCGKNYDAHRKRRVLRVRADVAPHDYKRDESRLTWRGWHAFRRGNATYLASRREGRAGLGLTMAAATLRHADQGVTDAHYNLDPTKKQERRIAAAQKAAELELRKREAAAALGAGFRQSSVDGPDAEGRAPSDAADFQGEGLG